MPPHDWFSWIWAGYVANRDDIVPIATFLGAVAAFITGFATLIYVAYSVRMFKQLREQTDQLRRSTSYDAV